LTNAKNPFPGRRRKLSKLYLFFLCLEVFQISAFARPSDEINTNTEIYKREREREREEKNTTFCIYI